MKETWYFQLLSILSTRYSVRFSVQLTPSYLCQSTLKPLTFWRSTAMYILVTDSIHNLKSCGGLRLKILVVIIIVCGNTITLKNENILKCTSLPWTALVHSNCRVQKKFHLHLRENLKKFHLFENVNYPTLLLDVGEAVSVARPSLSVVFVLLLVSNCACARQQWRFSSTDAIRSVVDSEAQTLCLMSPHHVKRIFVVVWYLGISLAGILLLQYWPFSRSH